MPCNKCCPCDAATVLGSLGTVLIEETKEEGRGETVVEMPHLEASRKAGSFRYRAITCRTKQCVLVRLDRVCILGSGT